MKYQFTLDVECFINYALFKFRNLICGTTFDFELWPTSPPMNLAAMQNIFDNATIYTFNGNNYDIPMTILALSGADNATLKEGNDAIIMGQTKPWDFYRKFKLQEPRIDTVDVMEVAAGVRIGLKMYGGRMHSKKIQDTPVDFSLPLMPNERADVNGYCGNDHFITSDMVKGLADRLELRESISEKYNIDVRSKSDAQIAEAVIKAELPFKPDKRYIPHGYSFIYEVPEYVQFATPVLQELLHLVRKAQFICSDKEEALRMGYDDETGLKTGVLIPDELKGYDIKIGHATYRIGIGGLHSQESCISHYTIEGVQTVEDIDVKSYYPTLILNMAMFPAQLGPQFLDIYKRIYDTRLHAKGASDRMKKLAKLFDGIEREKMLSESKRLKTESDGLKIVLNGTFGKLFSKWSILYAPELGIKTTLSGQLSLLMLIEMMELSGIRVASANTDGIVLIIPHGMKPIVEKIVSWWETQTNLEMEYSAYRSIHMRDVNNYIAITTDGEVKRKGVFSEPGLIQNKHPDKSICADAVLHYLMHGTPIKDTIMACNDIRKFIVVRAATGGAKYSKTGEYLGKAVRWYYGKEPWFISYVKNSNKVAGSDFAVPCMELPVILPDDINYAMYIKVAEEMLHDIGVAQ